MDDNKYTNPVERLDDFIDKMSRGIMPAAVDDLTMKEIELRMAELSNLIDDDGFGISDDVEELSNEVQQLQQKARESKRKASRKDIAIFTLTEAQKEQLKKDMSSSFVRSNVSPYNDFDSKEEDVEKRELQKRASRIRRCYYHADEWINAIQTILDIVEYDARNYPWMTKKEYYQAFWNGTIQLNVVVPILFLDYHTPIRDPETLISIFKGETIIEEVDNTPKPKVQYSGEGVSMRVNTYTVAESDYLQNLAAKGYDTVMNVSFKNATTSLYERFLPVSKSKNNLEPGKVHQLFCEYRRAKKFNGLEMVPYGTTDIVDLIHKANPDKLNTSINSNMTVFLNGLNGPDKKQKIDTSFSSNDVLINAEAAIKEASILANIKSLSENTKY